MFYIYDNETKEFLRETEGQPNPLEGGFFTPPFSTTVSPPSVPVGTIPVWNGTSWDVVADNRGKDYWDTTTKEKVVFELGIEINAIMTDVEPIADLEAVFNGTSWEVPTTVLEARLVNSIESAATQWIESVYSPLKQRKLLSIAVALQDKVINGFTLTVDEENQLQFNRDVNAWITSVRDVENTAIAALTPFDQITFPAKPV